MLSAYCVFEVFCFPFWCVNCCEIPYPCCWTVEYAQHPVCREGHCNADDRPATTIPVNVNGVTNGVTMITEYSINPLRRQRGNMANTTDVYGIDRWKQSGLGCLDIGDTFRVRTEITQTRRHDPLPNAAHWRRPWITSHLSCLWPLYTRTPQGLIVSFHARVDMSVHCIACTLGTSLDIPQHSGLLRIIRARGWLMLCIIVVFLPCLIF